MEAGIDSCMDDLNDISDDITEKIQKSIYDNYLTFIDAGKAISSLEINMHQIHSSISELKILISMVTDKFHLRIQRVRDELPIKITEVFQEVHGLSNDEISPDESLSTVVDVFELDDSFQMKMKELRVYLLTGHLLIASRQKQQDTYLTRDEIYDLNEFHFEEKAFENYLIVSIINPSKKTRHLSFKDGLTKCYFVESLNKAFQVNLNRKQNYTNDQRNVVEINFLSMDKEDLIKDVIATTIPSVADFVGIYSDANIKIIQKKSKDDTNQSKYELEYSWLKEIPEDLDVAIAEREFQKAIDILLRAKSKLKELLSEKQGSLDTSDKVWMEKFIDLNRKMDDRSCYLASVLQMEIMQAADRHGWGLIESSKSVYVVVRQLILLGRRNFANELFLVYRSGLMNRILSKNVRQEGNQFIYINRLSLAFNRGLIETYLEWNNIIKTSQLACHAKDANVSSEKNILNSSKISQWIYSETQKFAELLSQILNDICSYNFSSMANCINRIKAHARQVEKMIKIKFLPIVNKQMLSIWQKYLNHQITILIDTSEQRILTESWIGDFENRPEEMENWINDMPFLADTNIRVYEKVIANTTHRFSRSFLNFYSWVCLLDCYSLQSTLMDNIEQCVDFMLGTFQKPLSDPSMINQWPLIVKNMEFLIRCIFKLLTDSLYNPIIDLDRYELIMNKFIGAYRKAQNQL